MAIKKQDLGKILPDLISQLGSSYCSLRNIERQLRNLGKASDIPSIPSISKAVYVGLALQMHVASPAEQPPPLKMEKREKCIAREGGYIFHAVSDLLVAKGSSPLLKSAGMWECAVRCVRQFTLLGAVTAIDATDTWLCDVMSVADIMVLYDVMGDKLVVSPVTTACELKTAMLSPAVIKLARVCHRQQ